MRVQTIRFDDRRRPRPRNKIALGFEGDNMVERLEFILPVIAEAQTAQLMMGGKYANAVLLQRDGEAYYADLTAEIVGTDGEVEAYVQINGSGGEAWHSDVMLLITGALPYVDREIETRYPTAVEMMLAEIAGHRAEMSETLDEAQAAADRAEDAAVNPPIVGSNGNWLLWDFEAGRYIDSGVAAQGPPGQAYTLPPATPDTLGGMMPGGGLTVDKHGRVNVEPENTYEILYTTTLEEPVQWISFDLPNCTHVYIEFILQPNDDGSDMLLPAAVVELRGALTAKCYSAQQKVSNGNPMCAYWQCGVEHGMLSGNAGQTRTANSSVNVPGLARMYYDTYGEIRFSTFNEIHWTCVSDAIPAKTTITVKGVRA